MRRRKEQLPLAPAAVDHAHARELAKISEVLDANSGLAELVEQDLLRGVKNPHLGCGGMSGDQVLRVLMLKQMNTFSYEDLEFHLKDSGTYRTFCRIGLMDTAPGRSTIAENVKKVRWQTLEKINQAVLEYAKQKGIEDGEKVRVDSTTVESHIHRPTDSGLLYDGVRVLSRLLGRVKKVSGFTLWQDHTRRAKRRMIEIHRTRKEGVRVKAYRDLLKVVRRMLGYARAALESLGKKRGKATRLRRKLAEMIELVERVRQQTEQRVLRGEKVEAAERIVSIFEPHADVLVKDHKDTYYGHKVSLTGGASGMLLDCVIEEGNPNDATRAVSMIKRQKKIYGKAPKQAAMDGTYASRPNLPEPGGVEEAGCRGGVFLGPAGDERGGDGGEPVGVPPAARLPGGDRGDHLLREAVLRDEALHVARRTVVQELRVEQRGVGEPADPRATPALRA